MLGTKYATSRQAAFTLTEAAIVLGIIGVIMGAIWVAASSVYTSSRTTTTQKQVLEIVQKTRGLFGVNQGNLLDMAITGQEGAVTLARVGAVPMDMIDNPQNPAAVHNMWRGNVTVTALNTVVAGDSFTIGLEDVPRPVCSELLVRMSGDDNDPGLIRAGTATLSYDRTHMPFDIVEASSMCSLDQNTILLSYMLKA